MKTFEMPKMNVAIFSLEDVITTSVEPAVENLQVAQKALASAGVDSSNITATTADEWVNASN